MKKNPTIIINNEFSAPKGSDNTEILDFKPSIVGNEKRWPPPDFLPNPLESERVKDIPTFKGKPLASGFGDPKHG